MTSRRRAASISQAVMGNWRIVGLHSLEAGWVRRLPDPNDRRGTLVEPTEAGQAVWDRTAGTQAVREARISSALDAKERVELHRLLRALMRAFPREGHAGDPLQTEPEG